MKELLEKNLSIINEDVLITIGNFDGVHLGHQYLIKKLKEKSKSLGLKLCLITFLPHPKMVIAPNSTNYLLGNETQKKTWLDEAGADFVVFIKFDRNFSLLSPEKFINTIILSQPHIKSIYIGHDFRFGKDKKGDISLLNEICSSNDINVGQLEEFKLDQEKISSTQIRKKIWKGEVDSAAKLLGRNYSIQGTIIKGDQRGRTIGFKTANIILEKEYAVPQFGVYVTKTIYKDLEFMSVTNVGVRPTFASEDLIVIETHILDFDQDIYGEELEVQFFKHLREEKKFKSANELIKQIQSDIVLVTEYFST